MKTFIIFLLLFALELSSAAPRRWLPMTQPKRVPPSKFSLYTGTPAAPRRWVPMTQPGGVPPSKFPLYTGTPAAPPGEVPAPIFSLHAGTPAAPRRWVPMTKPGRVPASKLPLQTGTPDPHILLGGGGGGGGPQNDETANNQVFPLSLAPAALNLVGKPLLKYGVKRVVCNSADSQSWVQEYYAGNEEKDAKIMGIVKVMSDLLAARETLSEAKKLNAEDNIVAKAELFDTVSDALEGALGVVGGAAKTVLCNE